jgi:pyruvate dehydrogenase E1 component alpha subunit
VKNIRATKDCIKRFRDRASRDFNIALAELDAIDDEVAKLIDEAATEARAAPDPAPEELLTDVYIKY